MQMGHTKIEDNTLLVLVYNLEYYSYPSAKRQPISYTSTEEARQGNTTRPLQSSTSFRNPATVYRKLQCRNPSPDRHRSKINPRASLH
jgi:hypothetical protein